MSKIDFDWILEVGCPWEREATFCIRLMEKSADFQMFLGKSNAFLTILCFLLTSNGIFTSSWERERDGSETGARSRY